MRHASGTIWRTLGTAIVVLVAPIPVALAQDAPAAIRFRAPAGCPDEPAVHREIEALLGRSLASIDEPIEVDAEVRQEGGSWSLHLHARDLGERDIAGESCAALAQATALMVAWMIDPAAETVVPAVTLSASPAPEAEIAVEPEQPATDLDAPAVAPSAALASRLPQRPRASRARGLADPAATPAGGAGSGISFGFGPSFVLDVGTLPAVTAGIGGEFLVRIDRLDLRLRGQWLAPQGAAVANLDAAPPGAGVVVEQAGGSVHACGRPLDPGAPALSLCGGIAATALFGRSHDVSRPGANAGALASLVIGAALPWSPIDELDLEVAAEVAFTPVLPVLTIGGLGDVFAPAPVSGRLVITGHVDVR